MYDFSNLKHFVETQLGIDTNNAKSSFTLIRERLTLKGLKENIKPDDTGIFYIDPEGKKHQGFLYIEKFDATEWRDRHWNDVPRFHIKNCKTINEQRGRNKFNGYYVFSNQPVIDVKDAEGRENDLLICGNCLKLSPDIDKQINTTTYFQDYLKPNFSDADLPKEKTNIDLDMFGYTPDWYEKSKTYRALKRYTCEECGLVLNDIYSHGYYLETHHINGNKEDNSNYNLKCLCTLCHAFVNERHLHNYQSQINKIKLSQFIDIFESNLIEIGNPYVRRIHELNL